MSFIDPLFWILLSTGFMVGFGHCIGMCGPIAVSLALSLKEKRTLVPHIIYNGGRITMYAFLGGIMGVTGSFTTVASNIVQIQKGVMISVGLLVILMGFTMSGLIRFGRIFGDYYNPKGLFTKGFQMLSSSRSPFAFVPLGLLLGLLPCGPVYTALIAAARAGMDAKSTLESFFIGSRLMFAFGLGTLPSLLIIARLTDMKWLKSREIIYKAGAVLMVILGGYFVIKGINY